MLLAIDVGNTNIVLSFCDLNGDLIHTIRRNTEEVHDEITLFEAIRDCHQEVKQIVFASVVPRVDQLILNIGSRYFSVVPMQVKTGDESVGLKIDIDKPNTLGADRIAVAIGGIKKYGNNLLILDFGTAITFDVINESGAFVGGVVTAGIKTSVKSLQSSTALLPLGKLDKIDVKIPRNIEDAIMYGLFFGYIGLVKEIVFQLKSNYNGQLKVVITGGEGKLISDNIDLDHIYDPDLVINGLVEIFKQKNGF